MHPMERLRQQQWLESKESVIHLCSMLCFLGIPNDLIIVKSITENRNDIIIMERQIGLYIKRNYPNYKRGKYESD